jgi:curved DNA-binding protein CbpA
MDPYKVLGVDKDAQITEIRQAHRKLVLKCHPDKVQDPELKAQKQDEFQKVQQAYEILSDEKERQKYDDKIRLAELRQQFQNKANSSATRSSPKVYEVRTVDPTSRSYTTAPPPAPNVKIYASYSRSYEDDRSRAKGYYDADIRIPRRETFSDKPSKREVERDRERAEKEREREKRRARKEKEAAAEELRRAEKAAKKERNKAKDKQRSKEQKREKEEKRRERNDAYIESYDEDEPPPLPRQSSKTYDERRERSSHRDETPPRDYDEFLYQKNYARAYIQRSQNSAADRYRQPPAAPTPPPAGASVYPPPEEEEVRRSSARSRRGSADVPPSMPKERSYHRSSREPVLDEAYEAHIVDASPAARSARRYAGGPPDVLESPPRGISRTHTMPAEIPSARPVPVPPRRSATYTDSYGSPEYSANRGRHRSKNMPQVVEALDSEDSEVEYERQRRSKHRSSRKTRSPESPAGGAEIRYQVNDGRTKLHSYSGSYSRRLESDQGYYHEPPSRPIYREPSYMSPASSGFKVKQSKAYNVEDVAYSNYGMPHYQEGMSAARA